MTPLIADADVFNRTTCLVDQDPRSEVIMNISDKPITKKKRPIMKKTNRKEQVYTIQPGEAKTTNNWLRDNDDFDIEAFPWLFSDGKYGLNYKREKPLTPVKYFASKVMNKNPQFSQDADFVFVAQQFVERYLLEGQIDVATRKGSINRKDGNTRVATNSHELARLIEARPLCSSLLGL